MTAFPKLENWNTTRDSLHTAAQVVGRVRKLFVPAQSNALHLALDVIPGGLSTGALPGFHQVDLDFAQGQIRSENFPQPVPIDNRMLQTLEAQAEVVERAQEGEGINELVQVQPGKYHIEIDEAVARDYGEALYRVYTAMARFRAGLNGLMTPLVLWPHHFDLSFLYFLDTEGSDEEQDPHINFGFAPFSDAIDRPYFYAYLWPMKASLMAKMLPSPAHWHDEDWQGAKIDYDTIIEDDQPERLIEQTLQGIFTVLSGA